MEYTKEELLSARKLIEDEINHTPILQSETLNALTESKIYFKCENLQKAGAFKYRGATHAVRKMKMKSELRSVATHSSGNHGRALAMAARKNGMSCLIVVPDNAPTIKIDGMKKEGAELFFCEPTIEARLEKLKEVLNQREATVIPPYDHRDIILGQSTCAQEIIEEIDDLDAIICPVGGGGLLSGTALAADLLASKVLVYAAEPEQADDAFRSMKTGKIEPVGNPQTIADGLRTSLGELTFPIIRDKVEEIVTVSESEIKSAMRLVLQELKLVIEASAAVSLAAIIKRPELFKDKKIAVVLSGGNVDIDKLSEYL